MNSKRFRLVIELDAVLTDPEWSEQDLIDNTVMYLNSIIDRAESERAAIRGGAPYLLDTDDITVWTREGYAADLAELHTGHQSIEATVNTYGRPS